VLGVLVRAREATRPTLVVVDDADRAGDDVRASLVATPRAVADVPVLVLVLSGDGDAGALARLPPDGSLLLQPLDVEAVHAIAVRYAPGHLDQDVPAGWLLDASGGVPLRVHELASQWARREAARRVGAVAEQAAVGRAELRSMEDELAVGVVDLQAAGEHLALVTDDDAPVVCPFKGLASFDVADAPYFFGREQLVAELVARSVGAPLLGVVGPSGSGKSSVVRAGLLPALAGGVLPDSEHWTQVLVRPGEHPLRELRDAVTGLPQDRRMLIAIDQFEETFTTCRDEDERTAFIAALARAARDPHEQAVVVIAIRADYYGRCAAYPELSSLLAANHVLVRPMQSDELRRAIELPAHRAGLRVEPELTDALVADTEAEPGALPLLSTALLELWQRRHGRRLRHADYEHTGGVRGAVARLAEGAYERLDEGQRAIARSVFLRLAAEGEESTVERRRVPLAELETGGNGDVPSVVSALADERLLTISAGAVEVAHEALLREWPRLRDWIEEDREGLRIHRRLTLAAREWDGLNRDDDALYRGARLGEADEWRATRNPTLNQVEREFLEASDAREWHTRTARRRRIALAFAALAATVAAISTVAIVALNQRGEARNQRDIAVSRGIAASATSALNADPSLGITLAMRALRVANTDEAASVLRQATLGLRTLAIFPVGKGWANSAEFSPDGRRAVTAGTDGRVLVWDLVNRRLFATLRKGGTQVFGAAFSPDGHSVAIATEDGAVSVTGLARVRWRSVLRVPGQLASNVAFSPDGQRLVAAFDDRTVRVVDLTTGSQRVLRGHRGEVIGAAFSRNGTRILSWGEDGTIRVWDSGSADLVRVLRGHRAVVPRAAFDGSGRRVVSAGFDNTIRVWDVQTGSQLRRFDTDYVPFVAGFSPNGREIVTGGRDNAVRILDASDPRAPTLAVLRGHRGYVVDARFSPDGSRILSAGQDGTVRLWDAGAPVVLRPHVTDATFSPDGRHVISAGEDSIVRIWSSAGGPVQRTLPGNGRALFAVAVAQNGRLIATGDVDGTVAVWRSHAGTAPLRLRGDRQAIYSVAFAPDNRRIASASADGRVLVWSLPDTRPVVIARERSAIHEVGFSPDGQRIVAAGDNGLLAIYSAAGSPRALVRLRGHSGSVYSATFSPDGRTVASGGGDGTVRVWTAAGRALMVMRGHQGPVQAVAFRPDGRRLVSAGSDGTVRVWDPSRAEALVVLRHDRRDAVTASFDPTGGRVLSSNIDGNAWITPCDVCGSLAEVLALARARAARQLTADERERYLASIR
jgi:WD40 repeat protein